MALASWSLIAGWNIHGDIERALVRSIVAGWNRRPRSPDRRDGGRRRFRFRATRPLRRAEGTLRDDRAARSRWPTGNQPTRRTSWVRTAGTAGDRAVTDAIR